MHAGSYLRCALVWQKVMVEERVFATPARITIGESPRATFTLRTPQINKRHCLFKHDRRGTVLALKPGMLGRIRLSGQTREADDLLADNGFFRRVGDTVLCPLSEGDGGVLVFGRVGLMFQFVQDLGTVERSGVAQILGSDGAMNRLFAAVTGFVLLFGFVSRFFNEAPTAFTVEQLPDRIVSYVIEDPESAKDFKKEMAQRREESKKVAKVTPNQPKKTEDRIREKPKENHVVDPETEKIHKKVHNEGMLGVVERARRENGALKKVFEEAGLDVKLESALDRFNRKTARVIMVKGPDGAGGPVIPGLVEARPTPVSPGDGGAAAMPETGRTLREVAKTSRLEERQPAKVFIPTPEDTEVTGGSLDKKEIFKVVTGNKGAIQYCYSSQLGRFPTLRGRVVVDFIIDTNGAVQNVRVETKGLSQLEARENVASCLTKHVRRWLFPKPQGGKVRVIFPFSFGRAK